MRATRRGFLKAAGLGSVAWAAGDVTGATLRAAQGGVAMDEPLGRVKPTPQQLAWQEDELSLFLHFGVNTFTDREWGEGREDPKCFSPTALDARQWVRVARDAGFKLVILTAKHHDGFCLWPSRYTEHSVKNSPWREGKGDVVREFTDACREAGMKVGFYLSPWDRHEPTYGDSPAYNDYFRTQLTELLTGYGEMAEVWFDGACGEGPNGKKQVYDFPSYYALIRKYQPHALIAICGPDIRWVGNETGVARETEWSVQNAPAGSLCAVNGKAWYPAECDVSIRPGWFWHPAEDAKVKSLEQLVDIYFKSVGRNSVLLLNVPPNSQGLIADPDARRLRELRAFLEQTFATDYARRGSATAASARRGCPPGAAVDGKRDTHWAPEWDGTPVSLEVALRKPAHVNVSMLQEQIAEGQRVEEYRIEACVNGEWRAIAQGTTVGHKKLDRFPDVEATRARLTILKSQGTPLIRTFGLFRAAAT